MAGQSTAAGVQIEYHLLPSMKAFLIGLVALCPLAAQNGDPLEDGKALYRSNCAFCHGLTGGGGRGPALAQGNFVHGSTAAEIRRDLFPERLEHLGLLDLTKT